MIQHSKRYADGVIHTNTIEGVWSLLKRAWYGSHHHKEIRHDCYCNDSTADLVEQGLPNCGRRYNARERHLGCDPRKPARLPAQGLYT